MPSWRLFFVGLQIVWLAWILYWHVSARGVKAVVRRESPVQRMSHIVPLLLGILLFWFPVLPAPLGDRLFPRSIALPILGTMLLVAGLLFTVWARIVLGGNWSGTVTVKKDHELIQSGPYRWVRHPIYTGLLLAFSGSALVQDRWAGVASVTLIFVAFWFKLRREEAWMQETFGERYARYRAQTACLIPFVL
jgi:protein-S-isoprenylcysteine O-methyltransferase Ste14